MTKRRKITEALANLFKNTLTGESPYQTNVYGNSYAKLKFWDEIQDFPSIYITPGMEMREYLPGEFAWGMLSISLKAYCRGDDAQTELEQLLADIELALDNNRRLVFDTTTLEETTEILITSITTDEGLLAPYAIGEINLQVRYQAAA
jgi:hypothetical protein